MHHFETSFTKLRCKEVVNSCDGKRIGHITDIIFSMPSGAVKGVVVPVAKRNVFSKPQDLFIHIKDIEMIGDDIILVNLSSPAPPPPPPREKDDCKECVDECKNIPPPPKKNPDCDGRCEKCMLFDCAYRWQNV